MSYRLGAGEPVEAGLRRIAVEQLDLALAELGDPARERHAAIHEARKASKRLRGVLRLARTGLGDEVYRRENAALRDAARRLSGVRDAEALLETYNRLDERFGGEVDRRRLVPVRRALAARHAALSADDLETRVAACCADFEEVRARLSSWPLANDFDGLSGGLRRSYKRGRKAMQAAYADPSDERFHDWRKRVKDHRYHLELLAALWPRQIKGRRKEAKALGDMLGEEHDLAVLEATLADDAGGAGEASVQLAGELAARRRAELRAALRPLGQRLFAEPPKALARRFKVYWQATRSGVEDGGALEAA